MANLATDGAAYATLAIAGATHPAVTCVAGLETYWWESVLPVEIMCVTLGPE